MALLRIIVTTLAIIGSASAFSVQPFPPRVAVSSTSLNVGGPLKKLLNKGDYEEKVNNLMKQKGYTREQAEKEYDLFLDNPENFALQKGEEYYKSLGYKSFMDGVIGEAEKEGKGDEVRARIAEFKKQSQLKAYAVIAFFICVLTYLNLTYEP